MPREKGGVVDKRLRLYGVRVLRVCDASVFPVMPRGNAITSVNAFGDRAADLVRGYWKGGDGLRVCDEG
jgi:choline dehydrogenase-like flavoprotein